MEIGNHVSIPATVVDFNQGAKTAKLKIEGFADDNKTSTEKYIRMTYDSIQINSDFCEWHETNDKNKYVSVTHAETYDSRVLDWKTCPYCGKPIRILPQSSVEDHELTEKDIDTIMQAIINSPVDTSNELQDQVYNILKSGGNHGI